MKKITLFIMLLALMGLFASEIIPEPSHSPKALDTDFVPENYQLRLRNIPQWEWHHAPQDLIENYADYFQAFNETPLTVQQDGEGVYIVYRVKDESGYSEVYSSFIDDEGNASTESLGFTGYYCDAEFDNFNEDVFACWHSYDSESLEYACFLSYNLASETGDPTIWKETPINVIGCDSSAVCYPQPDDEFLWPQLHIGSSPLAGHQRVYLAAKNNHESYGQMGLPCENPLIAFADYNADSLAVQSDFEWRYTSIPWLDSLSIENPQWGRVLHSWNVVDSLVIFMGYIQYDSDPDELFCCINEHYGEGEWDFYSEVTNWPVDLPPEIIQPGMFDTENQILHSSHFNLVHTCDKVRFPATAGLTFDSGTGPGYYYPDWGMLYPKSFNFDLNTHEFSFTDVYFTGANPNDDIMMTPWDLNEDGELDERPDWVMDWPIFHFDPDAGFHNNELFMSTNPDKEWIIYLWVDGLNAYHANAGTAGFEGWDEFTEIAIVISNDNGESLSDPIFMNANPESENYVPELEGMIPCFAYPGDYIEDLGNEHGLLHLFFLNDNEYGSYHSQGMGTSGLSHYQYAAIDIDFLSMDSDENSIAEAEIKAWNYPNPFNPTTTIAFTLTEDTENTELNIYNVKGQKVESFKIQNSKFKINSVVWNAEDQPSGVYFYKIKTENASLTGRMLLIK